MSKRAPRRPAPGANDAPAPEAPAAADPAAPCAGHDQQAPPPEPPEPADEAPPTETPEGAPAAGAEGEPGEADAPAAAKRKADRPVPPPPERLVGAIEALLLAAGDVLTPERIRDVLGLVSVLHVREALDQVRVRWASAGLAVELQEVARGVRVVTRPEYADYVRRLSRASADDPRLSQGLLETLSIVAYRQPVARAEIERIRGVQAGEALRALLDRHLVKVVGRSEQPGRPLLYGTTTRFLTVFGLADLKDLPSAKELARL